MRRFSELAVATVLTLALGFGSTAVAAASTYQQVLHAYEQQGTIAPCEFTSTQLAAALKGVDTYGAQYFADFTQAIQAALTFRAAGECLAHSPASPAPTPGGSTGATPGSVGRATPLGPLTAATSSGVPAPLIALAALASAVALIGGLAGVTRLIGRVSR